MDKLNKESDGTQSLPYCAPCRALPIGAPIKWIKLGWQDLCHAPKESISTGMIIVLCGYVVLYFAMTYVNLSFLFPLLTGFIFLGPIVAMAFYEISARLERKQRVTFKEIIRSSISHLGDQMVFAIILVIIFLIWARAASLIHVFFPVYGTDSIKDIVLFLSIGTSVGAIFSFFVFCMSAFSLPMLMDQNTDSITAIVTSVNAVIKNRQVMFIWSVLIVLFFLIGLLSGLILLAITLPIIGHATWHAYLDTIDISQWRSCDDEIDV